MPRKRPEPGPALKFAEEQGQHALVVNIGLAVVQLAFRLAFAGALAIVAGGMIQESTLNGPAALVALASLVFAIATSHAADRALAADEMRLAMDVRATVRDKLDRLPADTLRHRTAGDMIVAFQRYPAQLARLVLSHRLAARMLSIGPLMAAVTVGFVSWEAAATLVVATPVMIIFFVLAGSLIQSRAAAQERALARLAAQFADRIRMLPTILANHAVAHEHAKLEARMRGYADATMRVLGVAFLNSGIIDFFSSLAIAVLAVFLGLGHLGLVHIPGFTDLHLWQSLFILMIAPEYFAPFRRYAEQYHAKAEGTAAAAALDWLFVPDGDEKADYDDEPADQSTLQARIAAALDIELPTAGLVAVIGASGAGKSTYLRALAGLEPGYNGRLSDGSISWVANDIYVSSGTLAEVVGWRMPGTSPDRVTAAIREAGLLDDPYLSNGLASTIDAGGENLSGGQRMRLAVARALASDRTIVADEPTAKLDPASAERIRRCLLQAAGSQLVVVATHDAELARLAGTVIDMEDMRDLREKAAA